MSAQERTYSEHLVDLALDLPIATSACAAARTLLLDAVACAIAGCATPGMRAVRQQMRDWGGKAEATALFAGCRLPMPQAAFVNSALVHALDFDDVYTPGTLHITSTVVPAMLAAAEMARADGRVGLAALIAGIEVAARLAVAERGRRRDQGFLPSSLLGGFGAVITAAHLLGLDREETADALGINYAQTAGNRQALLDATLTKRLQPAFAVRSALWAVSLARRGVTGPRRVFEGPAGYFRLYANGDVPPLSELVDVRPRLAVEHVSTKRYPSCGACHSVQAAAEQLREEEGLSAEDIARVQLFGTAGLVSQPFAPAAHPQVSAQFSVAWAAAHTLLRGRAGLADYAEDAVRADEEVCALARAIEYVAPPEDLPPRPALDPVFGGQGASYRTGWQGLIVHTRDGRRLIRAQAPCQTFRPDPGSRSDAEAKLDMCCRFAGLDPAAAPRIAEAVRALGDGGDIPALINAVDCFVL